MKNKITLQLFLGLVLAGCTRTNIDSSKFSSDDPSHSRTQPAIAADKAAVEQKDATKEAHAVAATTPPMTTLDLPPTAVMGALDPTPPSPSTADVACDASADAKPAIAEHIAEWRLSANDLQSEYTHSGQIIRTKKTVAASEPMGPMDGILAAQIKDKLRAEQGTAALAIKVKVDHGTVMLTGFANSLDQIGDAIAVAHDTPGIKRTISQIKLKSAPKSIP